MNHAEVKTNGNGTAGEVATQTTRLRLCEKQLAEQATQLAEVTRTVGVLVAALRCVTATLDA